MPRRLPVVLATFVALAALSAAPVPKAKVVPISPDNVEQLKAEKTLDTYVWQIQHGPNTGELA